MFLTQKHLFCVAVQSITLVFQRFTCLHHLGIQFKLLIYKEYKLGKNASDVVGNGEKENGLMHRYQNFDLKMSLISTVHQMQMLLIIVFPSDRHLFFTV